MGYSIVNERYLMFFHVCLQDDNPAPPEGLADQMFYSTVSCLDRKSSISSDEEGDIYCHTLPPAAGGEVHACPSNHTEKMADEMVQDRDRLKPDQVRHETWLKQVSLSKEFSINLPCFFLVGRKLDGIFRTRMWNTESPGDRQVGQQVTQSDFCFFMYM